MKIGLVGLGVVGTSMLNLFEKHHALETCDKFLPGKRLFYEDAKKRINACDLVFLAVNTPTSADGLTADLSAVEECVGWITAPLCIRSTVPPGTTKRLMRQFCKPLAFCPEHLRETTWDAFHNDFVIVGGSYLVKELVVRAFQAVLGAQTKYIQTDACTAELSKYMLNNFLATKVAFCNQYFDLAQRYGVDYNELRELWLLDDRIGRSHTMITHPLRAFGGKCLPKDLRAMVAENPDATVLKAVLDYNKTLPGDGR